MEQGIPTSNGDDAGQVEDHLNGLLDRLDSLVTPDAAPGAENASGRSLHSVPDLDADQQDAIADSDFSDMSSPPILSVVPDLGEPAEPAPTHDAPAAPVEAITPAPVVNAESLAAFLSGGAVAEDQPAAPVPLETVEASVPSEVVVEAPVVPASEVVAAVEPAVAPEPEVVAPVEPAPVTNDAPLPTRQTGFLADMKPRYDDSHEYAASRLGSVRAAELPADVAFDRRRPNAGMSTVRSELPRAARRREDQRSDRSMPAAAHRPPLLAKSPKLRAKTAKRASQPSQQVHENRRQTDNLPASSTATKQAKVAKNEPVKNKATAKAVESNDGKFDPFSHREFDLPRQDEPTQPAEFSRSDEGGEANNTENTTGDDQRDVFRAQMSEAEWEQAMAIRSGGVAGSQPSPLGSMTFRKVIIFLLIVVAIWLLVQNAL